MTPDLLVALYCPGGGSPCRQPSSPNAHSFAQRRGTVAVSLPAECRRAGRRAGKQRFRDCAPVEGPKHRPAERRHPPRTRPPDRQIPALGQRHLTGPSTWPAAARAGDSGHRMACPTARARQRDACGGLTRTGERIRNGSPSKGAETPLRDMDVLRPVRPGRPDEGRVLWVQCVVKRRALHHQPHLRDRYLRGLMASGHNLSAARSGGSGHPRRGLGTAGGVSGCGSRTAGRAQRSAATRRGGPKWPTRSSATDARAGAGRRTDQGPRASHCDGSPRHAADCLGQPGCS